jgi:hypothetical protein
MERLVLLGGVAGLALGCLGPRNGPPAIVWGPGEIRFGAKTGSGAGKAAEALLTSGATLGAAAVNHEVATTCYAACALGTVCDTTTGLCAPLPCHGTCRAEETCGIFAGQETCVRSPFDEFGKLRRYPVPDGGPPEGEAAGPEGP